ncbi:16S rRNA (guanine(966)-N(2))-methyltransferase RsmD [Spiribacter sp. 1M153]|uniref:16S rRNA (guanine(966)-N(2))-methyltransferase RsmD n=1 Tax=Spiribacter roseus TaxID=1855875 RepID=UPI00349FA0A5
MRIIGGDWGGRRFPVSTAAGLRPTADRNRETLFNWLQPTLSGARVLDLFAGTGALGLEALSRGASCATFVERSRPVAAALQALVERLEATSRARVVTMDARRFLRSDPVAFDLVFLDPPFASDWLDAVLTGLAEGGWLADTAQVYVETRAGHAPTLDPGAWACQRQKTAGDVWFGLLQRAE